MTVEDLIIVGGGAAGVFAAISFVNQKNILGHYGPTKVVLVESSNRILTKVKISGGGRCNVTHNEFDLKRLVSNYPRGS